MDQARINEANRIFALHSLDILDTPPTEAFDRITRLAARIFSTPIALISFVDVERQWFKSRIGLAIPETGREHAFCDYTLRSETVLVVPDATRDERFRRNPMVTGSPGIRFYAGAPLILSSGHAVGSLCLIDHQPRDFDDDQQEALRDLAAMVVTQIELQHSAGRVDGATHLPNRTQLAVDLRDLCVGAPDEPCVLILLELLEHATLLNVIRASGTGPVEEMTRSAGRRLQVLVNGLSPVYQVDQTRLAIVVRSADTAGHESFLDALLADLREPFLTTDEFLLEQQPRVGAAHFRLNAEEVEDALRRATAALYHRESQRGVVVWYDAEEDIRYRKSYQLLRAVPHALSHGEFSLAYQPQLERRTLGFHCAEALLRWKHPVLGNIPPGEFIPLVENTSLIHPVTRWVVHTALAQLVAWQEDGLVVNVAVNISARNLEDPDFIAMLQQACALHGIAPARLQLECTENVALTGKSTRRAIDQARAMGIQIALDDFGSGYCNFGSLYSLPAEVLKLDQSLIRPIDKDQRAQDIVRSMVRLGHALGYRMLAEGVETATVFDILIEMGCDEIQGYYVSRPLPPEAAFMRMKEQNDVFLNMREPAGPA